MMTENVSMMTESRVVPSTFFIDFPSTIELTWYKVKSTLAPGELRQYQVNRSPFSLTLVRRLVNVNNRHDSPHLGPYSRTIPRVLRWYKEGGGGFL